MRGGRVSVWSRFGGWRWRPCSSLRLYFERVKGQDGRRVFLLLVLLATSCAGPGSASGDSEAPGEKSVFVGELLAIFPGFFVHGLGHRYAGNTDTADEILTMELYSLLTAGLGGGLVAIGDHEDAEAVEIAGWVGVGVGGLGFLGTWIYDIVFTPSEVNEYNRRLNEAR
jgi:hypothetical protein